MSFLRYMLTSAGSSLLLLSLTLAIGAYDTSFLSPSNLTAVLENTIVLFVMASGLTLVIMIGGIDLSVQSIASLASCILAVYVAEYGNLAIGAAILAGAIAGLFNGLATVVLRIPSFIVTLAIGGMAMTAANWISDARSISMPGGYETGLLAWIPQETLWVSNSVWIGLALGAALSIVLKFSIFGFHVMAIGAQERAVIASGINAQRVKITAFCISGTTAAVAGVLMAMRFGSGSPTLANEFLLPAIACVIVGGTAITGGVGSIWRTLVGALIIQIIQVGMTYVGLSIYVQPILFGLLLVGAVALTMDRRKVLIAK